MNSPTTVDAAFSEIRTTLPPILFKTLAGFGNCGAGNLGNFGTVILGNLGGGILGNLGFGIGGILNLIGGIGILIGGILMNRLTNNGFASFVSEKKII